MNNKQIDELIRQGIIELYPSYESTKLQIAQYPLFPMAVLELDRDLKIKEVFRFDHLNHTFYLKPKKYYLVDVVEDIKLPVGIIGRFIPSSNCIEKGITLTTGKIEYPFGQNREKIRFGIFNCLETETTIEKESRIAYIQFFDLRGLDLLEYKQTAYEDITYNIRKYYDSDGPNYEMDNHE